MALKTVSTLGISGGGGGGGTPGGANTQVQFNSSGSFGGSANLTWDGGNVQIGSSGRLKLSNGVTNYVAFNAPSVIPANVTWTLPSTDGASGNFLITNGSGTLSWAAANLTPIAPSNYSLPQVSGTTTVGQTLSSTTGGWNGYPAPTYAYQWVRGASNIANATSATYPLIDLDYNNTIKVIVIATNSAGNATANSVATANIAGTVPGAPTIGTAVPGNAQASVAFTANTVTGGPNVTIYTATSNPGNITGTNNVSPVIVSGLTNGNAYTFTVTATNSIGTSLPSAASNSVTPSAVVQDASFSYVPMLLETTSNNTQSNKSFLDSSSNTFSITPVGTPAQGSVTPYWPAGQWSVYFSSSYLSVADSASLRFGSSNFTIEAWVYRTASGATHTIACKGASTPTGWVLQVSSADKLVFIDTSTSITGSTSLAANTWYYVAVVRAGTGASQTTLYVNGVSDGTGTSATTFSQTDAMRIGTDRSAANNFAGYISNLRLSNTNLTISSTPTTPLIPLGSTIFYSLGYNRFVDGSSLNSVITVGSGTPAVQSFQPFSPSAAYSATTYGGSAYFNGSTDYLSSTITALSGQFTIDFWLYRPSSGNNYFVTIGDAINATGLELYTGTAGTVFNVYSAGAVRITSSTLPTPGAWNYVAITRDGSSAIKLYLNGSQLGSTYTSSTTFDTALKIAAELYNSTISYGNGYISNFRISNVVRTVTSIPTVPITSDANTIFLANFTNAGIYDATTQNVVSTIGDAQVSSTITPKWGTTSMKFDGTGDWLITPINSVDTFGSGNWTIEGWFNFSSVSGNQEMFSKATLNASLDGIRCVLVSSKVNFQLSSTGTGFATSIVCGTTLTTGVWYYLAFVRSGNAITVYLNGTSDGTGTFTGALYETNTFWGLATRGGYSGSTPMNGYIQDFRITKGVARIITASPTAAFPVQ